MRFSIHAHIHMHVAARHGTGAAVIEVEERLSEVEASICIFMLSSGFFVKHQYGTRRPCGTSGSTRSLSA
jgi:hypothetical protein